jgi:hypothetical protein
MQLQGNMAEMARVLFKLGIAVQILEREKYFLLIHVFMISLTNGGYLPNLLTTRCVCRGNIKKIVSKLIDVPTA